MNKDDPSLAYRQEQDEFAIYGSNGSGPVVLSLEDFRKLLDEGHRLLLDRSLRRHEWNKKTPPNDSAEVSHQEA
ncbi:MAG: hypothetical protein NUW02_01515 [Candidatus Campbellbacteria bacterium]|nr:hypothetical protein [Candidatus Campbellbacteria bacterium]